VDGRGEGGKAVGGEVWPEAAPSSLLVARVIEGGREEWL
jgi:hypothetical protein